MEFDIAKGSIWEIYYYTFEKIEVPETDKQKFIDSHTRTNQFDAPHGLSSSQYGEMFITHFLKTRNSAREMLDDNSKIRHRYMGLFQIGNKECIDDLSNIEKDQNFHSWENESIVNYFRTVSKNNL